MGVFVETPLFCYLAALSVALWAICSLELATSDLAGGVKA